MKLLPLLFFILLSNLCQGQNSFDSFLKSNRQDLTRNSSLDIGDAKMIGYGALHGSSKTEETEIILLKELIENHNLKYYLPETDFSTANYFQKYIETGDEKLLEELVYEYGAMVPQEKSIEMFEKWQTIRPFFLKNNIKIIGVDKISSFKFPFKEFLSTTEENKEWVFRDSIKAKVENVNTIWSRFNDTKLTSFAKRFVEDYEKKEDTYRPYVIDTFKFDQLIKNLKQVYESYHREKFIYKNYLILNEKYDLKSSLQFARFGVFHIMKSKINNSNSFFSMLIENAIYTTSELYTIQAFLTKSSVMWNEFNFKTGEIKYATKKGYGIGDYWLEHFHKIRDLKNNKLSDITLFRLNEKDSPYSVNNEFRLIKVKNLLANSRWHPTEGKSTLDYIDYAILISNSAANRPIEDMH